MNHNQKNILLTFFISDISKLIIDFVGNPTDVFDKKFINKCIIDGDHLFFNDYNESVLYYLFRLKRYNDVIELISNSKYLKPDYFQNFYYGQTETYHLCKNKMSQSLLKIGNWKTEHFQHGRENSLHLLCENKMSKVILSIKDWEPKHSQHKYNHKYKHSNYIYHYVYTELYWLCKNKMIEVIRKISNWKPEHFLNTSDKSTELYWLCNNKMSSVLLKIDGLGSEHFYKYSKSIYNAFSCLINNNMKYVIFSIRD